MVDAASKAIRTQGSVAENMARRIDSAAIDQAIEYRRIFTRAVASAVRKWIRATTGTRGAFSSSSAKICRLRRRYCGLSARLASTGIRR